MKKRIVIGTLLLALCLLIIGVSLAKHFSKQEGNDKILQCNGLRATTEEGYFYMHGETLHFYDFKTLTDVVVCNKPNCLHKEASLDNPHPTCNAVYGEGMVMIVAVYEEKIYIMLIDGTVYRTNLDGSNRETLIKLNSNVGAHVYFSDGKIYYDAIKCEMNKKTSELTGIQEAYVGCIDIKNKTSYAVSPKIKGYSAQVQLLGMHNNIIYYFSSKLQHKFKLNDSDNKSTINYYQFNLKSKKEDVFKNGQYLFTMKGPHACFIKEKQDGTKTLELMNLDTQKSKTIIESKNLYESCKIFDNNVFYGLGTYDGKDVKCTNVKNYHYSINKEKSFEIINNLKDSSSIIINNETSDKFIILIASDVVDGVSNNVKEGWILKSDYYNGKLNYHLFDSASKE
jgi:hypothetical protein